MAAISVKLADGVEFLLPHLELTPDVEKTLMSLLHAGGYGGPLTSPGSTFQPLCKENCDCAPHLRHLERQAATVTLPLHGKIVLSYSLILGVIPLLGRQSPSKLRAKPKKTVRKSTPTKVGEKVSCGNSVTSTLSLLVFINGRWPADFVARGLRKVDSPGTSETCTGSSRSLCVSRLARTSAKGLTI